MGNFIIFAFYAILSLIILDLFAKVLLKINMIIINNKTINLQKYQIDIQSNLAQNETLNCLDKLICDTFNEYFILNIQYKLEQAPYISDKLENQINRDVASLVGERISPMMISKLSMIFNKKIIPDIISTKVYLKTFEKVLEVNPSRRKK